MASLPALPPSSCRCLWQKSGEIFAFSPLLRSIAASRLQNLSSARRSKFTLAVREPDAASVREAPTPLVFLTASLWDGGKPEAWKAWQEYFSKLGYTSLAVDLEPPRMSAITSAELMKVFEQDLFDALRTSSFAFPPILFARTLCTIPAQTYISSNSVSALLLRSPPVSNAAAHVASLGSSTLLPTVLDEFRFEPFFPIAIMAESEDEAKGLRQNRLMTEYGGEVDLLQLTDEERKEGEVGAAKRAQAWLDEIGF